MTNLPSGPSENAQANATGDSTVTPLSQLHTEKIVFTGSAGTRNVIIGTTGLAGGARIDIQAAFDCDNGVRVIIKNVNGTVLFDFTRNGDETSAFFKAKGRGWGGLEAVEQTIPAFPAL
jgi:hypothetical protein